MTPVPMNQRDTLEANLSKVSEAAPCQATGRAPPERDRDQRGSGSREGDRTGQLSTVPTSSGSGQAKQGVEQDPYSRWR